MTLAHSPGSAIPRPACAIVVGAPLCRYTFFGTYTALCGSFAASHSPSTPLHAAFCSKFFSWLFLS